MQFLHSCQHASRALAVTLCTALAIAACEKSHEEKARDRIDLGDYDRARAELSLAIGKNPKNAGARIVVATSYIRESGVRGPGTPHLDGQKLF